MHVINNHLIFTYIYKLKYFYNQLIVLDNEIVNIYFHAFIYIYIYIYIYILKYMQFFYKHLYIYIYIQFTYS